MEGPRRR